MSSDIIPINADVEIPDEQPQLPAITDQQMAFVYAYCGEARFNATQAAIAAGYSPENARKQGWRLTTNAHVRAHIDAILDAETMQSSDVLRELTTVAAAPTSHFMQVLQAEYTDEHGRKHPAIIRQDYSAKIKALELLGKARGLFREQVDINVKETKTIIGVSISDISGRTQP